MSTADLSRDQARRIAVRAQGLGQPRPAGRIDRRHLRRVFDDVGVVQIDSVNVLVRSHEMPLFARLGPHPRRLLPDAAGDGEVFEYWAHEAAFVPSVDHRLWRWRMAAPPRWRALSQLAERRPGFVDEVLARVAAEGPLSAGELDERVGPKGTWWDWDDGKIALEYLLGQGELVAVRRPRDFARLYDLTERVLPAAALAAPDLTETEAGAELLERAARSYGVATLVDLADYHRQKPTRCKPLVQNLVDAGRLVPVTVEGWERPAFLHPDAIVPRRVEGRALLSPFDSLVWNRERNLRLFDFHYRIEIYTPAAKRVYGYYVLPFLLDDRLVARVDLKADRSARTLLVKSAHPEPGCDPQATVDPLLAELLDLARWLGLERLVIHDRGQLAPLLRRAHPTGRA
ncbi:MAG: winged helix-turn-helix domain-containing protein [Desertimonas sp.]